MESGAYLDYRDKYDLTALHHAIWNGFDDVVSTLLRRGADINATSSTAGTPLCLAVLKQQGTAMKKLLEYHAAIDLASPDCGTPLHCAALVGSVPLARELLKLGAAVDSKRSVEPTKVGWVLRMAPSDNPIASSKYHSRRYQQASPLLLAVLWEKVSMVKLLLDKGSDPNLATGFTAVASGSIYPLGGAAMTGHLAILQLLISKGASLELGIVIANHKFTPLSWAVKISKSTDCAKELIHAGAFLDAIDDNRRSAVHNATLDGQLETLRTLCNRGAHTNLKDYQGGTPLVIAVRENQIECLRILLAHSADPNFLWDKFGNALHWAVSYCKDGRTTALSILLEAGADMGAKTAAANTPLVFALKSDKTACLHEMLSHVARQRGKTSQDGGSNTSYLQDDLNQLLLMAAPFGSLELISRLIQIGADVVTRTEFGETAGATALHIAAEGGYMDIVVKLLDAGADPSVRDAENRRPEKYAKLAGHQEIYELLLDKLRERY